MSDTTCRFHTLTKVGKATRFDMLQCMMRSQLDPNNNLAIPSNPLFKLPYAKMSISEIGAVITKNLMRQQADSSMDNEEMQKEHRKILLGVLNRNEMVSRFFIDWVNLEFPGNEVLRNRSEDVTAFEWNFLPNGVSFGFTLNSNHHHFVFLDFGYLNEIANADPDHLAVMNYQPKSTA